MQIDRRLVTGFDWPLFVLTVGLALLGIMTIYSATCGADEECPRYLATKQSYWLAIGLVLMVATFAVDYQHLNRWAYPIYAAVVILLALVLVIGITSGGSQRWLDLRFFSLQPSEFAKLALVLVLAKTLCYYEPGYSLTALGVPLMLCTPVLLLVLLQPDLGTAVLIFLIAMGVVVMSGLRMRSLLYFGLVAVAALPVGWKFLKPYQKTRIWTFDVLRQPVTSFPWVRTPPTKRHQRNQTQRPRQGDFGTLVALRLGLMVFRQVCLLSM